MDLGDASLGFYRVWFASVGARNGLFAAMPATPAALAKRLALDEAMVARWCRGAEALGLLARKGETYRVPAALRPQLADPEHAQDLTGQFRYLTAKSAGFGALDELLRGKAASPDLSDVYALATAWDHRAFFELALPRDPAVRALLKKGCDVLDLGAGFGGWSAECARRFPKARIVASELEGSAHEKLAASTRLPTVPVGRVPDGSFDLVYMGEVLSVAGPRAPLATALRALRPGGHLRALEGLAPPRGAKARTWGQRIVLAMDFDFALDGSRYLTVDEAGDALREAGFVDRTMRDLGGSLYLLGARKRQTRARG